MARISARSAWTKHGKIKPVDRKDNRGKRVTEIHLLNEADEMVVARFGDVVRVRGSSFGATAMEFGTIDGFTEHRVRVLVGGKVRNFVEKNLMFVRPSPCRNRASSRDRTVTPERTTSQTVITIVDDESEASSSGSSDGEEIVDPRAEPEKYFEQLGDIIETYTSSATDLAMCLVRGRQVFDGHGSELSSREVLLEFNRRMKSFREFTEGLKAGRLVKM